LLTTNRKGSLLGEQSQQTQPEVTHESIGLLSKNQE